MEKVIAAIVLSVLCAVGFCGEFTPFEKEFLRAPLDTEAALAGLTNFRFQIIVENPIEPIFSEKSTRNLSEALLRKFGVPFKGEEDDFIPTVLKLHVYGITSKITGQLAYNIELKVSEFAMPARDMKKPRLIRVTSWHHQDGGLAGEKSAREAVSEVVDSATMAFINAWLKANPAKR